MDLSSTNRIHKYATAIGSRPELLGELHSLNGKSFRLGTDGIARLDLGVEQDGGTSLGIKFGTIMSPDLSRYALRLIFSDLENNENLSGSGAALGITEKGKSSKKVFEGILLADGSLEFQNLNSGLSYEFVSGLGVPVPSRPQTNSLAARALPRVDRAEMKTALA